MELHEAFARAMMSRDEAEARVYGWLPGVVTDIDTKLMQIKARIGKQGDNESTDWLVPMGMGSVESLPEVGDAVGVMFHDGDVHRGAYFYYPQSTTKGRPTFHVVLGENLAAVVNQLKADLQTLVTAYNAQVYANGGSPAKVFAANLPPGTINAGNCLASDGSTVASKSGDQKVLSKRTLVR